MQIGFRAYALTLMISAFAVAFAVLTVALAIGPSPRSEPDSYGDLTRLGWFANSLYAPSRPQLEFLPPRFEVGRYERYHDVLILGDSYSESTAVGWPNYLAGEGSSVLVVPPAATVGREIDVESVLASAPYRAHPPQVFIYQTVERELKNRFSAPQADCGAPMPVGPEVAWLRVARERPVTRPVTPDLSVDLDDGQIAFARDFIVANLKHPFRRREPVVHREILRAPRFSSKRPRALLFYSADLATASLEAADLDRIRCGLLELQRRIEAGGTTRFIAMIVPDKRSIYAPDVAGAARPGSIVPKLADPRLTLPRLDLSLRTAVESGELDVYLPNDTHWGAAGHRIAAETVLAHLRGEPL